MSSNPTIYILRVNYKIYYFFQIFILAIIFLTEKDHAAASTSSGYEGLEAEQTMILELHKDVETGIDWLNLIDKSYLLFTTLGTNYILGNWK